MKVSFMKKVSMLLGIFMFAASFVLISNTYAASVGDQLTSAEPGWTRYDDMNPFIKYEGSSWEDIKTAEANTVYARTGHFTQLSGPTSNAIKIKFSGTKLRIIDLHWDNRVNNVNIEIDGITSTYNPSIGKNQYQVVVFEALDLPPGVHEVKLTTNSISGNFSLDAIDIDADGKLLDPYTPDHLGATPGDGQVTLNWNEIQEADSYTVRYGTESGKYTDTVTVTKDAYGNYVVPGLTNGTTYYFVVTATVNGAESARSVEVSAIPQAAPEAAAALNVTIAEDTVKVGDEFKAAISLDHVNDIYAEDFKIKYDTERFEYVGFDEVEGFKVYNTTTDENGNIRFIVASQGEQYGITGEKIFLNLNFRAKAVGMGDVSALYCRVANTTTEWNLEGDACGSDTVTVELADVLDVNHSGEYTLVDLAIDGYYFGRAAADTDTINHSADQILDGNINDDDLVYIVNQMLGNTNYTPNFL